MVYKSCVDIIQIYKDAIRQRTGRTIRIVQEAFFPNAALCSFNIVKDKFIRKFSSYLCSSGEIV